MLWPGAPAAIAIEGAAEMLHLVVAALGIGLVPIRNRNSVTPDFSAASASRRLAVSVNRGALPQNSITTADNPEQAAASTAALNNILSSGNSIMITEAGSPPNSLQPGM